MAIGGALTVTGTTNANGGIKAKNIFIEANKSDDGPDVNRANEINNFASTLWLQYGTNNGVSLCYRGGNVAIGASPSSDYKLYVNGKGYFTNTVYFGNANNYIQSLSTQSGGLFLDLWGFSGVHANGNSVTSDIRQKNIVKYVTKIKVDDIAKSPIFDFTWKRMDADKTIHTGTSAQYWINVLPNAVSDMGESGLSLD